MAQRIRLAAPQPGTRRSAPSQRLHACIGAFFATMLSFPAAAVTYPTVPLQSGDSYPPANVMFILDDSGSMSWDFMPGAFASNEVPATTPVAIQLLAYTRNTLSYNPNTTYLPWMTATGTRMTGGTSYNDAYSDNAQLTGSINLALGTRTFYVPKPSATNLADSSQYYRYQILVDGRVVQSQYDNNGPVGTAGVGCSGGTGYTWRRCSVETPTGRTEAAERQNYATWYSYHRTRSKVAKAGASEAFNQIGSNLRVGFDSIWNRSPYSIPVGTSNGEFSGTNRSDWYGRLHGATASGGTPLKGALQRTGNYYANTTATGPWGPEAGAAQLSCRQNFAILTTDGYWNSDSGFTAVGDADGTAGVTHTSTTGATYAYAPARPYTDAAPSRSDTLADVAMQYWKNDLRPTLANNVPTSSADPAFWQHMVTFGVSIGQKGNLDPATDLPSLVNGSKSWGNPNDAEDADRIDDLWHASVNGRGRFVVAANPNDFATALSDALNTIAERAASASNVSANSTSFQTDTRVYQASYVARKWSGELAAYDATSAGVAATPAWRASQLIPTSGRRIYTWNGSAGRSFPTAAQTSALVRTTGTAPVSGSDNADYISGRRTLERQNGGTLRDRDTVLGDIVNSSPIYVRDNDTLFAGANDGMLHAFAENTGVELFAYVPGGINLTDLSTLSDPYYTHRYFVDGPITVSTRQQTPGRNYLVGALGRGGKGLFGLDVTTPGSFGNNDVLWERTTGTNMGQVLGQPLIVTLNNGAKGVVVGNGMNSTSGRSALFILDLVTGAIIREFDTGVGGDNGMGAPRGWDSDGNGTVDVLYAGDLRGNVWKFNVSGATSASWTIANTGNPLFTARDSGGNPQPITAGLALAKEPLSNRIWVFAGTGRYISSTDATDTSVQSVYGLIDDGTVVTGRGQLQQRGITVVGTVAGRPVRAFEPNGTLAAGQRGWFIDMTVPTPGERVVSDVRVRGKVLLFASIIPGTSACEVAGSGYINALDAFSGTSLSSPYFDVTRDGTFNDDTLPFGGGTVPIGSVDLGGGMPTLPTIIDRLLVAGGSKGGIGSIMIQPASFDPRRVSWREIIGD